MQDLVAQETMADAAIMMAITASSLTVAVTAIGTWLIRKQGKLTRKAVKDTGEATVAMAEANEIARETQKRQLRAYVEFEDVQMVGFVVGNDYGHLCQICHQRQASAYDVQIWSEPIEQSKAILDLRQFVTHLGQITEPLINASYERNCRGDLTIVWGGVISYRDAFGTLHRTTFKYLATGDERYLLPEFDMKACSSRNSAN